mmetsp:Transcript_32430/g.85117  ORF Transcript_32430/g.85117 Transcript_32430/m.85117 type:complete len:262 (-) Transcript_32430:167-952(-)
MTTRPNHVALQVEEEFLRRVRQRLTSRLEQLRSDEQELRRWLNVSGDEGSVTHTRSASSVGDRLTFQASTAAEFELDGEYGSDQLEPFSSAHLRRHVPVRRFAQLPASVQQSDHFASHSTSLAMSNGLPDRISASIHAGADFGSHDGPAVVLSGTQIGGDPTTGGGRAANKVEGSTGSSDAVSTDSDDDDSGGAQGRLRRLVSAERHRSQQQPSLMASAVSQASANLLEAQDQLLYQLGANSPWSTDAMPAWMHNGADSGI